MTLRAYAKINLGLQILGKRPDGYHDIETVFHQINIADEIEVTHGSHGVRLHSDSRDIPSDQSNLCVKAALLLQQITGMQRGADIVLRKRIPIGAGLGGGSSDAAATLIGLTRLWGLDISNDELRTLSLSLGADVPFFIDGGTAYATGKGERLEPIELEVPYWILTVTPAVHVSTSWAYGKLELNHHLRHENLRTLVATRIHEPRVMLNKLRNDFEPLVFRYYPEVMQAKERVVRGGADFALMSGSGSSVFGLFSDGSYAKELADALVNDYRVSLTEPYFKPEPIVISE
ncbi:MAG: 4-(cytidine 5'-diphospho)-2-C-methyl-D-erythritol kinase [Ignavibacteriae bacterium]|nr:4-(cytidine 5'-diphospho)-2-C-methyl-D-erythritol kinase [Ignavibacteriota bacterium]